MDERILQKMFAKSFFLTISILNTMSFSTVKIPEYSGTYDGWLLLVENSQGNAKAASSLFRKLDLIILYDGI